jgi:hypothetical protein
MSYMVSQATVPALSTEALATSTTPAALAKAAGLRYVSDRQPGYRRLRRGRGFAYY